jgi:hypothetical protein
MNFATAGAFLLCRQRCCTTLASGPACPLSPQWDRTACRWHGNDDGKIITDKAKRELFDRLALHLTTLADQVEQAMGDRKRGISSN